MSDQLIIHCQKDYELLGRYLSKLTKPLLVCGNSAKKLNVFKYITKHLKGYITFSDFSPNPTYESAVLGTKLFTNENCDSIIAVGGGSAIDVAKCIKHFSKMDMTRDLLSQEPPQNTVSFLAVPTTAGTGSEATHFAVIYLNGEKISVAHQSLVPDAALIDPTVLESLPLYQRKATAMDAICHAVEAFWSVNATEESKSYSKKALSDINKSVEGYLANDPNGNLEMLIKANFAGKAINIAKTTAAHAMSYKLTSLYKISHGHAAALCLKEVWRELLEEKENPKLSTTLLALSRALQKDSPQEGYELFCSLIETMSFDTPKATDQDISLLTKSVNLQRLKNTPLSFSTDTIYKMYKRMLQTNGC